MASWREPARPKYEDQPLPDKNYLAGNIRVDHAGHFLKPVKVRSKVAVRPDLRIYEPPVVPDPTTSGRKVHDDYFGTRENE